MLVRPPANSGFGYTPWVESRVSEDFESFLLSELLLDCSYAVAQFSNGQLVPFGHYKVSDCSGEELFFLRSYPVAFRELQSRALLLTRQLAQLGCSVIATMENPRTLEWESHEFCVELYPFIRLTVVPNLPNVYEEAGYSLASLHRKLSQVEAPWWEPRVASTCHFSAIRASFDEMIDNLNSSQPFVEGLDPDALSLLSLECIESRVAAQPIHGDLNIGNALWSPRDLKIVWLDFEESSRSFFSPLVDIAFFLERSLLVNRNIGIHSQIDCGLAFLESYISNGPVGVDYSRIRQILVWNNTRLLTLVYRLYLDQSPAFKTEGAKFVSRLNELQRPSVVIDAWEKYYPDNT